MLGFAKQLNPDLILCLPQAVENNLTPDLIVSSVLRKTLSHPYLGASSMLRKNQPPLPLFLT